MNERIKELALQAGAQGIVNRDFIDIEKFAELIVRECVDRIRHCMAEESAREYCARIVELHFGVEE